MNNLIVRKENGEWWFANRKNEPIVKFAFSEEMEYAYNLGIEKGHKETLDVFSAVIPKKEEK